MKRSICCWSRRLHHATPGLLVLALSLVVAGCDPGLSADELPTDTLSAELRSSYRLAEDAGDAGEPLPGCGQLTAAPGAVWQALPLPDHPGMVMVERDGVPICVDTVELVASQAPWLDLSMRNLSITPPALGERGRPSSDPVQNSVGDDPIPLGKGAAEREPTAAP